MTYIDGYLVPVPTANRKAEPAAARKFDATLITGGEDNVIALDSQGALFGLVSPKLVSPKGA
jgi:hypothetical protein